MQNLIHEMMAVKAADRDKEWLKTSLQAAIELELATLPPYLCAMWSIKNTNAGSHERSGGRRQLVGYVQQFVFKHARQPG